MYEKITLIKGDITTLKVDAVVNAANNGLLGGGGVDGAIHRGGGPLIAQYCGEIRREKGGCETGDAVLTSGGNLPSKYIIHTVGPVWNGGHSREKELLRNCYRNSLMLAKEHHMKAIAFPNISTGVYGYPKEEAAKIATTEVSNFLKNNDFPEKVIFICFDQENYNIYNKILKKEAYSF
ncbi:O-acetyl-ADP-ribose deacetylase [uncultured Ilyobacter sp.]|uniref:O-acetyl-ADP-ribose deacetylase n=1 Tax=uncultured Ilyobacter sp. TaxID=544433 RepID=UPI0029F48B36|nr:O-acetyl-ADP-ribose deacetylase [uncultured Ilyobacter sp.]